MTTDLPYISPNMKKLPQNELAQELLGDIEDELRWNGTFESTKDELGELADKALKDFKAGRTKKSDFDEL